MHVTPEAQMKYKIWDEQPGKNRSDCRPNPDADRLIAHLGLRQRMGGISVGRVGIGADCGGDFDIAGEVVTFTLLGWNYTAGRMYDNIL
jgi:hypothetical protein